MILTLIAKKVTANNGNQFIAYSCNRRGKWYDVRFTRACGLPKKSEHIAVSDKAYRVFIDINPESINLTMRNNRDIIYVSAYTPVTGDELEAKIAGEKQKIDDYIKQKDQLKRDFFATESAPPVDTRSDALASQNKTQSDDDDTDVFPF